MARITFVVAIAIIASASASKGENPIRKVVTMMQKMAEKMDKDVADEKKLYEKFQCHCTTELANFGGGKAKIEAAIQQLTGDVATTKAAVATISQEIDAAVKERTESEKTVKVSTDQRDKEAAERAKFIKKNKEDTAAMNSAIAAINKAKAGGAFLQIKNSILSKLSKDQMAFLQSTLESSTVTDADRDAVTAFLSGESMSDGVGDSSDMVTGMLKQQIDSINTTVQQTKQEEKKAVNIFQELMNAKKTQIKTVKETIAQKIDRRGELKVKLVELKGQLSDAQASLKADFGAVEELKAACESKAKDWEVRQKAMAEEKVALQETIGILNNDDSLDLFKKTLPAAKPEGTSLLQLTTTSEEMRQRALHLVHKASKSGKVDAMRIKIDMLALQLAHRAVDFTVVMKMIDDMVKLMKKEQKDDDAKKAYCNKAFFESKRKQKELKHSMDNLNQGLTAKKADNETLTADIASLMDGIAKLDKDVTESTEQRKKEHEEFQKLVAGNAAAKNLLLMAKDRMNKFYHPEMVRKTTAAPAPESFLQEIRSHSIEDQDETDEGDAKPKEAPKVEFGKSNTGGGNTVIKMIQTIIDDLDKEAAAAQFAEKDAQKFYVQMVADCKKKREADTAAVAGKEKAKAETNAALVEQKGTLKNQMAELKDVGLAEKDMHLECDYLLQNFDLRKDARLKERESLESAKFVLAGAQ